MKTITQKQYFRLKELRKRVVRAQKELIKIEKAARQITKDERAWGVTFDYIYNDLPLNELLMILEIRVGKSQ